MQSQPQHTAEDLARTAWTLSGHMPQKDITGLAQWIAEHAGGTWDQIRDGIVAGLRSLSGAKYYETEAAELACMGHCEIGDWDCYWWHNGAESDWSCDMPEWWEEQVETMVRVGSEQPRSLLT